MLSKLEAENIQRGIREGGIEAARAVMDDWAGKWPLIQAAREELQKTEAQATRKVDELNERLKLALAERVMGLVAAQKVGRLRGERDSVVQTLADIPLAREGLDRIEAEFQCRQPVAQNLIDRHENQEALTQRKQEFLDNPCQQTAGAWDVAARRVGTKAAIEDYRETVQRVGNELGHRWVLEHRDFE